MTRRVPVLVVAVAVLVATGVGGVAGYTPVDADPTESGDVLLNRTNTSNVLRLPTINRSTIATTELDLSTALRIQDVRTEWRLLRYTVEERFAAATTTAERLAVLRSATARAEQAVAAYRQNQRRVFSAYMNGSIEVETLLERLGRLQTAAQSLDRFVATVAALNQRNATTADDAVKNRLLRVRAELAMLTSPVRQIISATLEGKRPSLPLFVGVGDAGITLSTVTEGDFVHHTVRLDHFADEPGTSNASEALDRWAEVYPTVWDPALVEFTGLSGAYRADLPFDGGSLVSYLDASTLAVYSETQSKTVGDLPTGPPVTVARDELVVTVNRTYPGGPLRVAFHTESGESLDGIVRVNGRLVGSTGSDGVLWTVSPADEFAVTVEYGNRQVAIVVTPVTTS